LHTHIPSCSHTYTRTCTCMYSTCIHTHIDIPYTYIKLAYTHVCVTWYMYIYIYNWIYIYAHKSHVPFQNQGNVFWLLQTNRYSLFHLWCVCVLLCFITPRPFFKKSSIWYLKLKVFSHCLLKRFEKCVRVLNLENPFKHVTKKLGEPIQRCHLFTNLKEKIRAHRASSKATRLFLTK